jgi:hypothetical protein
MPLRLVERLDECDGANSSSAGYFGIRGTTIKAFAPAMNDGRTLAVERPEVIAPRGSKCPR